jgi:RHS repeat-associated protein
MTVRTDNLFIAHYQGSLLEEFHYYPFGMCFEVSKSPMLGKSAAVKYNSQLHDHDEFEDANGNVYGLEDYNFAFRNYDAQIGRWLQPDPLMQHPSPYLAMSNNPVSFTDPTGLWDDDEIDIDFNFNNNNDSYKPKPKIKNVKIKDPKNEFKIEKKRYTFGIYSGETFLNTFELPENSSGNQVYDVHGKKRSVGAAYGEKAGRYITSTKNWALGLKAKKGEGGLSGTDKTGYGLNAAGIANGAKTGIIDYAVKSSSTQTGIRAELQVLGKTGTRYLSAAKGLGFMSGVAGVAVTGIDAYNKGEWQGHHTADVLIGLGSLYLLTGPVGWTVGGGYFLLDVSIKSYTGKSITENLFDKP